jgi:hypothetical protein
MIKGSKRKNFNAFEEDIIQIAGYCSNGCGLDFHFEHIYQTFLVAIKSIQNNSEEYKKWIINEDPDVTKSLYNDPNYLIKSELLVPNLLVSYFVNLHSELELVWHNIFKDHFPTCEFYKITFNAPVIQGYVLSEALEQHNVLKSYNFIRNKIYHGDCKASCFQYQIVKNQINSSLIKHLRADENGDNVSFQIEDIEFCRDYGNEIIHFIRDIAEISYSNRIQNQTLNYE